MTQLALPVDGRMVGPTGLYRTMEEIRGKPVREWGTRNGVNVQIIRDDDGSVVKRDCLCMGFAGRFHDNARCPLRASTFCPLTSVRGLR